MQYIPKPDPQVILPPLLACLPTAFVSPRPPPALLPQLAPILQSRVQYLLTNTLPSSSDSWLPLLCWDSNEASHLVDLVSDSDAFEPHPTSGEIEIGDVEPATYRRLDKETLQARLCSLGTNLEVILLWCGADTADEPSGWRIYEVRPLVNQSISDSNDWHKSMSEAEEAANQATFEAVLRDEQSHSARAAEAQTVGTTVDEDDYWAQYDKTPNRTPGVGQFSDTAQTSDQGKHARTASEAEYFERYTQVQPDMDSDDPSEQNQDTGQSTLNGNVLVSAEGQRVLPYRNPESQGISQPSPSVPSGDTSAVQRLEDDLDKRSTVGHAVRRHVSSSVKSLFKLCRSTGMEMDDFRALMWTEIESLRLLEEAD